MTYSPRPIDVEGVRLPLELRALAERLAENAHEVWAKTRVEAGWRHGEHRDDAEKTNPCLVPYADLPDAEKETDRRMVTGTLEAIVALGYRIVPPRESSS